MERRPPVLSWQEEAKLGAVRRSRKPFAVLVHHLLHRFLNHELLASDNESKRVLLIAYAVALPTLVVSLFLFVPYHALPPLPHPRPFWSQVGDHYFFVMYAFVLMGLATVYEWDLMFPDLLDVYVLSVLPIPSARLFAGRVLAVLIFLAVALFGTSSLGIVFFPLLAGLPAPWHHLFAHAAAVLASGAFAGTLFLASQGLLLNVLGEQWFRRIGPLVQGLAVMSLLAVLLLTPTVDHDIQGLITASNAAVKWYPPFWFLGTYERLLHGRETPAVFVALAWRGVHALVASLACLVGTYPVAYRRRVRQLIEGEAASRPKRYVRSWHSVLHGCLLRKPAQRASFHLANQTVLRTQRHRVMLALYGGLMLAVVLAEMLVFRIRSGHVHPVLLADGIRAAVPITVYLTVVALCNATWLPVDRRGTWLFRSILGRPRPAHLSGTRRWVSFWAAISGVAIACLLHWLAPRPLRGIRVLTDQIVLSCGLAIVLADLLLYSKESLPFTEVKNSSVSDLPLSLFRNFVLFPAGVMLQVALEPRFEHSWAHLAELALFFTALHSLLHRLNTLSLKHLDAEALIPEDDIFPQGLGLRDG